MSGTRMARFGRGSVILSAQGDEPIGLDAIKALAPAVYAEGKHESRSDRYSFIPTSEVLEGLWHEGFRPFEVRQGGSADEIKRNHTKHLIRLRRVGQEPISLGGDLIKPEITLLNSHDGTSRYRLCSGAWRFICSNGLWSGEMFEEVRIPHKGDVVDRVIEGVYTVVEDFPRLTASAGDMSAVSLTYGEQAALATAAAQLRWEGDEDQTPPVTTELNRVRRPGDQGGDLWRTFNRIQENLLTGGQHYVQTNANGRRSARRTRPVNGIDQNRSLNRALWTLAEEMKRLKAA